MPGFHVPLGLNFVNTSPLSGVKAYGGAMLSTSFLVFATVAGLAPPKDIVVPKINQGFSADRMVFIPNQGQWDPTVKFLAKGQNVNLWVTSRGLTYDFYKAGATHKRHVVKVAFPGSNVASQATGLTRRPGELNYMIGRDQTKWATHVPIFEAAKVSNLYEGVDLVAYFDRAKGMPRYDMVVHPGANPSQIAMRYSGVKNLRLSAKGNLAFDTSLGQVQERDLVAYQGAQTLTPAAKMPPNQVSCAQQIRKNGDVQFSVGRYDSTKTLVLDPLIWSTFMGGSNGSTVKGIAVGNNDDLFVAGTTGSNNFPTTAGAFQEFSSANGSNVFVARMYGSTSQLKNATFFGGTGTQSAVGLALNGQNDIFVAGNTSSSDFPTSPNAFQASKPGSTSAFVIRLSANCSTRKYATYLGGSTQDQASDIAIDANSNAYITGQSGSTDFPTSATAYKKTNPATGGFAPFVAKINSLGTQQLYGTYLGGTSFSQANGIAVDSSGKAFVVGSASGADFPTTLNAAQATFSAYYDAFALKLNAAGSALLYSTFIGGNDTDLASKVAVDGSGAAYVAGSTFSTDFPTTPGAYQNSYLPYGQDPFVTKVAPDGHSFVYSTYVGHAASVRDMAIDAFGGVFLIGSASSGFPTTTGSIQPASSSDGGVFVTALAPAANQLNYSTYLGGSFYESGEAIALNSVGAIFIGGGAGSVNFPTTPGSLQPAKPSLQGFDAFVAKIDPTPGISLNFLRILLPGGVPIPGTVTLPAPAGPGGVTVQLKSYSPTVKLSVTNLPIAAGATVGSFTATTSGVDSNGAVIVTATLGADRAVRTLGLTPSSVSSVLLSPSSVWGGTATPITGKIYLNGVAGPSGVEVTLSSSDPSVTFPVNPITFPATKNVATFNVNHSVVPSDTNVYVFASPGGGGVGQLAVKAIIPKSLSLTPSAGMGGMDLTGKVTLNHAAGQGGAPVVITFSSPSASTTASPVVVPEGSTTASFTIHTALVPADEVVTVSATNNGTTVNSNLTLHPYSISAVQLTPTVIVGGSGTPVKFRVTLSAPAPVGGMNVNLTSTNTNVATIGATGHFAAGETWHDFDVTALSVLMQKTVYIKAEYNGGFLKALLTVNP